MLLAEVFDLIDTMETKLTVREVVFNVVWKRQHFTCNNNDQLMKILLYRNGIAYHTFDGNHNGIKTTQGARAAEARNSSAGPHWAY
jgi:hypothetical protein